MGKTIIHKRKPTAAAIREELKQAILAGNSGLTQKICAHADKKTLQHALLTSPRLVDELKPVAISNLQKMALWEIDGMETVLLKHERDTSAELAPLKRQQKRNFSAVLAEWLTAEEISDADLCNSCKGRLERYRDHNPPHLLDKRSFVEILAAAERDGKDYATFLDDLAAEWSGETKFTPRRLAKFLLEDMDHTGITVDEVERWLKDPGYDIKLRDKVTELVCYRFGLLPADEFMLWRLANGEPKLAIDENASRADIFNNLREKVGAPPIRLYPVAGIEIDAASEISRGVNNRRLKMRPALEFVELVQPSRHWLTDIADVQKADANWRLAQKLGLSEQARSFEDILGEVIGAANPGHALMAAIVGKDGINPQGIEVLQRLWQAATPTGAYSLPNVEDLKLQKGRALTLAEADVVIKLARETFPRMSEAHNELCHEILTRCLPVQVLLDRYTQQRDSAGDPAVITLKDTLEQIALQEGKFLEGRTAATRYMNNVSDIVIDTLRKEDRIGNRAAPLFADRLGLEGNKRREFMLKAQHIEYADPMAILDRALGGEISQIEGLKALIEQTGMSQSGFGASHGHEQKEITRWCNAGFTTDPNLMNQLADDLGRPEMAELLTKTFHRKKAKETDQLDEAVAARTSFHQSRVVRAALDLASRPDRSR